VALTSAMVVTAVTMAFGRRIAYSPCDVCYLALFLLLRFKKILYDDFFYGSWVPNPFI
jgi:hypothetical protein